MIKKKILIVFLAIICLNICLAKSSFAVDETSANNSIPDYTTEFVGIDKWENFNRKIFIFNLKANKYILLPATRVWASIMPTSGMLKIQNVYNNINYPVRLVSSLCQKDFETTKNETKRFFINTTWGIAGINDPALTKLNIKPRNEDMEQAIARTKIKQGPYLVVPIIISGNMRDIAGYVLDLPLNPTSYLIGPISLISSGVLNLNKYTELQPIYKLADNYPDPYQTSKLFYGVDRYIKNNNIDYIDYINKDENIVKIQNFSNTTNSKLKADVQLHNYNSQGALSDALRTILFDGKNIDNSKWSELSIWNKSFANKFKTSSVRLDSTTKKYKFKYILQKNKNAPLAVIYPSIGESVMSAESLIQAKLLYDEGYSVVIQGSSFQWQFVKSMPSNYKPGLPNQDAYYLRIITSMIIDQLQNKYSCTFSKKTLVGTSFGALTGIFAAAQEDNDKKLGNKTIGFSNYIFICPPIQILYALKQIDKYSQSWKDSDADIKMEAATTSEKVIQVGQKAAISGYEQNDISLPFSRTDAGVAIGIAMKQKLSDVIFTIEKAPTSRKSNIYDIINHMSFNDYAQKYLINTQSKSIEELDYETSLYSIGDFLKNDKSYKIYHSIDDCFVNQDQLAWLKKQTGNKSTLFSNGSHLGFLYRDEFIDDLKKTLKTN